MERGDRNTFAYRWETIAGAIGDRPAIVQGERTLTWREWEQRSNQLANALVDLGLERGDRVGIMEYNSIPHMESLFGILKTATCQVNVNYRYYDQELVYIIDNSDASVLIMNEEFAPRIERIRDRLEKVRHFLVIGSEAPPGMTLYEDLVARYPREKQRLPWRGPGPDDILLLYTGGTTGLPKGVMWRQEDTVLGMIDVLVQGIGDNASRLADAPQLVAGSKLLDNRLNRWLLKRRLTERLSVPLLKRLFNNGRIISKLVDGRMKCVVCAPLMHGTAVVGAFTTLMLGGTVVLLEQRRFSAAELWRTVERLGRESERTEVIGILIVGDAFAVPMVDELERGDYDTGAVDLVFSSGVLWSPQMKKKMLEHMPQVILQDVLGATEGLTTGYATTASHADIPRATFKVRKKGPAPVRVIDQGTGRDVEPGSGQVGVMAIGGHVPVGYWKDPEKSQRVFRTIDGRRYNVFGDMCTVDSDGFIQLIGRGSQCINSGGEKVYPEEVEEVLAEHPDVRDVGVVGVPHRRWGEAVTAVVVPRNGTHPDGEQLIAYCRGKIADYKLPKNVVFTSTLERMPSGKKEYALIREKAREALGR